MNRIESRLQLLLLVGGIILENFGVRRVQLEHEYFDARCWNLF